VTRAYIVAIIITGLGLLGFTSSLRGLGRALGNRWRAGKPYVIGSIQRSLTTLVLTLLLTLAGVSVGGARWLTRDYQHVDGPTRAARMRVDGKGALTLQVQADTRHPGNATFISGLEGETWQVRGMLITFPAWTRRVGLGAFHRLTWAGSPGDPPGQMPESTRAIRQVAAALPAFMGVNATPRILMGQGELPIWTSVLVNRDGYTLGSADGGDALDP
jgi:hypothetical protein